MVWIRIQDQLALFGWVFRDCFLREWKLCIASVFISTLSVAFLGAAFVIGVWYASVLGDGTPNEWFGRVIDPRTSGRLLVVVCLLVFALGACSAALDLVAAKIAVTVHRRCSRHRMEEVVRELARPGLFLLPEGPESPRSRLSKLMGGDAAIFGRVARDLLGLPGPVITLVVALGVIAWIEPVGILLMVVAGAVVAAGVVGANRRAVQSSREFEELRPIQRAALQAVIREASDGGPIRNVDWDGATAVDRARQRRMYALADNKFASSLALFIAVTLVLGVLGWRSLQGAGGWETILISLIALRFAMSNLRTVLQAVISVNRFHIHVDRTRRWAIRSAHDVPVPSRLDVPLEGTEHDDPGAVDEEPGGTLLVVTPQAADRIVGEDAVVRLLTHAGVEVEAIRRAMRTTIPRRGVVVIGSEEPRIEGCPVFVVTNAKQAANGVEDLVPGLPKLRAVVVIDPDRSVSIGSVEWWRLVGSGDSAESRSEVVVEEDEEWDEE